MIADVRAANLVSAVASFWGQSRVLFFPLSKKMERERVYGGRGWGRTREEGCGVGGCEWEVNGIEMKTRVRELVMGNGHSVARYHNY